MPAKLVVTNSAGSRREYWVEDSVLRLGRDPKCDVELPAPAPDHAATVEYHGGRYYLYNRGDAPIRLADHEVSAGGKADWPANTSLVLTGGSSVRLEVQGSPEPSPAPRPADEYDEPATPDVAPEAKQEKSGAQAWQAGVAGLCFLMAGLVLYKALSPGEGSAPKKPGSDVTFSRILDTMDLPKYEALSRDPEMVSIVSDLRKAEIMKGRGDFATARRYYQQIIRRLRSRRNSDFQFDHKIEEVIYGFASSQAASAGE